MRTTSIVMVCGSFPPTRCGVGDYTFLLFKALKSRGLKVTIFTSKEVSQEEDIQLILPDWKVRRIPKLIKMIRKIQPDAVHVQYPTIGYGINLGPQFLTIALRLLGKPVITTLHEFSAVHLLRRLSIIPFLLFSNSIIFTTEEEKNFASRHLISLKKQIIKKSTVIPVGSNLPPCAKAIVKNDSEITISFFGLFYPARQVETIIRVFSELVRKDSRVKCQIVGDKHPRHEEYFSKIKNLSDQLVPPNRINWLLGKSSEDVSNALSHSDLCVLPYLDGATFRRTSLLAAMSAGVPVVTTKGNSTPCMLVNYKNIVFAREDKLLETIVYLLDNMAVARKIGEEGKILSNLFSWEKIAEDHMRTYELYLLDNQLNQAKNGRFS